MTMNWNTQSPQNSALNLSQTGAPNAPNAPMGGPI